MDICLGLVGISGVVPTSFSAGVLVPFSARSIKSLQTLPLSYSFSFPLVGGVGGGSILLYSEDTSGSVLLVSEDGGGMCIPGLAGGIPLLAGSTIGQIVSRWLA